MAALAKAEELVQLDRRQGPGAGIEGLFLAEIGASPSWPPESTTDGLVPGLCLETGEDTIELVAMCWIDFNREKFPLRALTPESDLLTVPG